MLMMNTNMTKSKMSKMPMMMMPSTTAIRTMKTELRTRGRTMATTTITGRREHKE